MLFICSSNQPLWHTLQLPYLALHDVLGVIDLGLDDHLVQLLFVRLHLTVLLHLHAPNHSGSGSSSSSRATGRATSVSTAEGGCFHPVCQDNRLQKHQYCSNWL
jgi:hypothetical protein